MHPQKTQDPIRDFWAWFSASETSLFSMEADAIIEDGQLTRRLQEVHENLVWEMTPPGNAPRELVISADGVPEAFDSVEAIADSAPKLPNWKVTRFRPRMQNYARLELNFDDVTLGSETIQAMIGDDGTLMEVRLFIKGCPEENEPSFLNAAYIMMDMCLGEFDVVTKIGQFGVLPFDTETPFRRVAWADLRREFDLAFDALHPSN